MGAWRERVIPNWPDNDFVKILNTNLKNRMFFGLISEYKGEEIGTYTNFIEGTFFAGSSKAVKSYSEEFYKLHDKRLDEGLFVGKDQTLMNILVFKTKPVKSVQLKTWKQECLNDKSNSDNWFFYQRYFSLISFYKCDYDQRLLSTNYNDTKANS